MSIIDKFSDSKTARQVVEAVQALLIEKGKFTIPEVAERTGISMTTVSKYVTGLLDEGNISAIDVVKTDKRGRRPVLYGVAQRVKYFASIDIRQFEIAFGLMDYSGNMLAEKTDRSFSYENTSGSLERACSLFESFLEEKGVAASDVVSLCAILGGRVNSHTGLSATKYTLEELSGTTLADYMTDRLGIRCYIENDTKAMAYGEYIACASQYRDVLFLNVGWGLGLGMVLDGKLHYGKDGYSGEFGHVPVYDNDVFCHCGKKGCLETEVSGSAIHRKLIQRIKAGESSRLSSKVFRGEPVSLVDILEAASMEDPLCVDLISKTGSELGRHVSSLINIFNPECIIVGGRLSQAASYYFLYPLQASIRKYSLRLMSHNLQIITSKLGERSGIFGACMVARNRHFSE